MVADSRSHAVGVDRLLWAVVPVKRLVNAKRRLTDVFGPCERRALVLAMLRDVLTALRGTRVLDGVMVVSPDDSVLNCAAGFGARVLSETQESGYSEAATSAACALVREPGRAMLLLPGDLPMLSTSDVEALVLAHGKRSPAVTLSPSRSGHGTNALLCTPPDAIRFQFGQTSFRQHLEAARAEGIQVRVVKCAGLGLDLDTRDDLQLFAAHETDTHTQRFLESAGFGEAA